MDLFNFQSFKDNFRPILKKYWLAISLGLFGLIFFIYGLISLFGSAGNQDIKFSREDLTSDSTSQAIKTSTIFTADIEGAVVKPGVYKLNQGAIVQDVLVMAGGLSEIADRDYVSKNLNLAAKVSDGAKIYIPKVGESVQNVVSTSLQSDAVNINTATLESLDTLSGIGKVTAQKIIDNRPYATINELLSKKVVSSSVFTKIKDRIVVY
jgi:competence protein ComEA